MELSKANKPPEIYKKSAKNRWFPTILDLKIIENAVFYTKLLNKICLQDFLRHIWILKLLLLNPNLDGWGRI
jgi:hypothetical protein